MRKSKHTTPVKPNEVTVHDDGTVTIKSRKGTWTWSVERVAAAKALSDLCVEYGSWDCECSCCVVTGAIASSTSA